MSYQSSRLVVKNLPNNITTDKLRTLFEKEGQITDLQLKYKKNGTFRNFAFIGYATEEEAAKMKEVMHNTCISSCKIEVEFCRRLYEGQEGMKESFSNDGKNKNKKSSANTARKEQEKDVKDEENDRDDDEKAKIENDPDFMEFVRTQRNVGTSKSKLWSNDDVQPNNEIAKSVKSKTKEKKEETPQGKPSVKGTFKNTVKLKGVPAEKCKRSCIKEFMAPLKPISVRVVPRIKGIAYVSFKTEEEVNQALLKHRNVLAGRLVTVLRYEVKDQENGKIADNPKNRVEKEVSQDVLVDTGRIFVRNLYYSCTEEHLEKLFSKFGPIAGIHLPIDKITKRIKGFGFVTFVFPEHAVKAFSELDGTIFQGRTLHLIPGESKPEGRLELESKSSFKKQKEIEGKEKSGKGHNWNSLFLNMNALSDVISERYDVKKSQFLMEGKSSESIPVRMALAETQIVNEMKKHLLENGVKLDAFGDERLPRSKTTILVKNLPAKTSPEELESLFSEYGTIVKIILPPMAVTAIVEVDNPVEARRIFTKFAYAKFKSVPLYLEWAPMDLFTQPGEQESNPKAESHENESNEPVQTEQQPEEGESEATVLVKNMNYTTDETKLKEHFAGCGKILNINIVRKKNADGTLRSMGYGFVQFRERKGAQKAMKTLQNSTLDEFNLELKLPRQQPRDKTEVVTSERKKKAVVQQQTGGKILVRNIPFQASEKEIEQLFAAFGQLKFVRLPKKLAGTGSHRGFGFVEYVSKDDAKRAFDALCLSTHLLGRRLVLEWAVNDDNTDGDGGQTHETLEKASRKMVLSDPSGFKKLKKSKLLEELTGTKDKEDEDDFDDV